MSRPSYMNSERREVVFWAGAMKVFFEEQVPYYKDRSLSWLNSIILSLDNFMKEQLRGLEPNELETINRLNSMCMPKLVTRVNFADEKTQVVRNEDLGDLLEYALENCLRCKKDYDTCELRKLLIRLGVPAWVETGPCQYCRD